MKPKCTCREQELLEVAERLFLEKGYDQTSTTEIAREAGCNQALVHYYYRTKEQLFVRVLMSKVRLMVDTFEMVVDSRLTFIEQLRELIGRHFDILMQNPGLPSFLIAEFISRPDRMVSLVINEFAHNDSLPVRMIGRIRQLFEEAIARGEVRRMEFADFLGTMISLNAALFVARPLAQRVMQLDDAQWEELLAHRREEHIRVLINSIKP